MTLILFSIALLLLEFAYASTCPRSPSCKVLTSSGTLLGTCNSSVAKYLSVPYADPPIGDKRFAPAKAFQGSSEIECTTLPPYCPQPSSVDQNEDCLFLNIYAPVEMSSEVPVMVWFHGGSFLVGGSADPTFDGTNLVENENVIVVTVNYRLGIFGFFDDASTGTNFGLTDAMMALSWVKENISKFGGNPNRVTIFGESSGGTLIRALLTSPLSRHLYRNAIIQSDPQAFDANPQNVSRGELNPILLNLANCSDIICMRSLTADDLVTAEYALYNDLASIDNVNTVYPYGPNIDYDIIPYSFGEGLEQGKLENYVDIIMGYNLNESAPTVSTSVPSGLSEAEYDYLLQASFGESNANSIISSGLFEQTDELQLEFEIISTLWGFECPTEYNIENIVKNRLAPKIYGYQLDEGILYSDNTNYSLCGGASVCHEDDLYLIWGTYDPKSVSESQIKLSREIQARWANFAKNGTPDASGYAKWLPATSAGELNIMLLGQGTSVSSTDTEQCNFFGSKVLYQWQT